MIWDRWQVYALLSAIFAAATAILGKIGVTGINSNYATFIRTVVILVFIAALVSVRSEWVSLSEVSHKSLLFLGLSGLATGLSWICYYRALQLGPATKVAPVDKLSVAFVIVLAALFLKEPLTWQILLGGGLIVGGSLVLVWL